MRHFKNSMTKMIAATAITATVFLSACGTKPPESTAPVEQNAEASGSLFSKGVWSASIDGNIDTYFVFADEVKGHTEKADGTGGVPFTCEQNELEVVFHFGSSDDVTEATFSTADNTGTFQYDDKTVVYTFAYVPEADPDNFKVPAAN